MKLILLIYLFIGTALAQDTSEKNDNNLVDDTHKSVSDTILLFTNRIDSFFGTRRGDEEANGSKVRVYLDHNMREYENDRSRIDLRFTLKLPQLEKLFKFKIEKKNDDAKNLTPKDSNDSKDNGEKSTDKAKANLPADTQQKWNYGLSAGVRVDLPPNPYLDARLRRTFTFSGFEFNPTQELSWFLKDGLGYTMTNDLDYKLKTWGLLRMVNSLSWRDDQDEIFTTHGPNFYLPINQKKAIQFYLLAFGRNKPTYYIYQYSLGASYRQAVYSNWIFLSTNPYMTWPETQSWKRVIGLDIRLEAVFGSI